MKFFAIIAIAFAASVTACKDDNIFCAPGMHPPKRSISGASIPRAVINNNAEAQINTAAE